MPLLPLTSNLSGKDASALYKLAIGRNGSPPFLNCVWRAHLLRLHLPYQALPWKELPDLHACILRRAFPPAHFPHWGCILLCVALLGCPSWVFFLPLLSSFDLQAGEGSPSLLQEENYCLCLLFPLSWSNYLAFMCMRANTRLAAVAAPMALFYISLLW